MIRQSHKTLTTSLENGFDYTFHLRKDMDDLSRTTAGSDVGQHVAMRPCVP